jgi:hypothetical protein
MTERRVRSAVKSGEAGQEQKGDLLLAQSKHNGKTARSTDHGPQAKEAEQCFR